ncbi:MAG: ATP-binding protein [Bacteroidaceae bacterium]|nr:ATP-binding protein [Bacteroidaceae bacterium]
MEKKLVIKNDISEISKLATFIGELSEELDFTPELNFNLNLVLEEAISNVILYAYGNEKQKDISLVAYLSDNNLVFVLTDSGAEFDPTKVPDADVTLSAEEREIGGLGIYLIRQIMNTVEYHRIDGKNVLTMRKELN